MKQLFIAEKPSVAIEFSKALGESFLRKNGYAESKNFIITWCVGHLVTMSYPEKYDANLKRWSLDTLPFLPTKFRYEIIPTVKNQFSIVKEQLTRDDVECIYICTDSGREGEYIYRLVDEMIGIKDKKRLRVWIDSQTEEEILRGIREAKDWSTYDALSESAYLRAKEDYLIGINFSRLLTLKYGNSVARFLKVDRAVLSVGRVMTCVIGMVVRKEREIRSFIKMPFYKVLVDFRYADVTFSGEWKVYEGSRFYASPKLYKDNGFKDIADAKGFIADLENFNSTNQLSPNGNVKIESTEKKNETKNPPLLFNLAELQNECAKRFKISPDTCLKLVQVLYEKKMVTYPRTDARVLSGAVAKEISKNLHGLKNYAPMSIFVNTILDEKRYTSIARSRYVNDKQITDHYAIIPTGYGLGNIKSLDLTSKRIFDLICLRFLSIFYPPAKFIKYQLVMHVDKECFIANFKVCKDTGYLKLFEKEKSDEDKIEDEDKTDNNIGSKISGDGIISVISKLKSGNYVDIVNIYMKSSETTPPKRYTSGSMILAMENAGQLIEEEELRSQIKGSGIGTSATRAEILKKLCTIRYLSLNPKTQVITPTLLGEIVFEVVQVSISSLLNPALTASWEKGLAYVAEGSITTQEYMQKLENFVASRTNYVKIQNNQHALQASFGEIAKYY